MASSGCCLDETDEAPLLLPTFTSVVCREPERGVGGMEPNRAQAEQAPDESKRSAAVSSRFPNSTPLAAGGG
jgi:hypothetical protein